MQRLAGGEDTALNEIIHRWQDRLISFLWHMSHDQIVARDLAQETFVRLYQNRHRYRPHAPFASYLFQIARNLLFNHVRWSKRHPSESLEFLSDEGFDPEGNEPSPDKAMVGTETIHQVRLAIADLPDELREAFILFTYQDLSYREISGTLGCSEKAVETRIYRARQILKEKLSSLVPST